MAQISDMVNYYEISDAREWVDAIKRQSIKKQHNRNTVNLDNKFDVKVTAKEYIERISIV